LYFTCFIRQTDSPHVHAVQLSPTGIRNITLSPAQLYVITSKNDPSPQTGCTDGFCSVALAFEYHNPSIDCRSRFSCSKLLGSSLCGAFGIEVSLPSKTEICRVHGKHEANLTADSRFEVELWYAEEATWDVQCMFWCTPDGEFPGTKSNSLEERGHVQEVLSGLVMGNIMISFLQPHSCFDLLGKWHRQSGTFVPIRSGQSCIQCHL
jgi:hypothetical protein